MKSRKKLLGGLFLIWIFAIVQYFIMMKAEPIFLENPKLFGFGTWITRAQVDPIYRVFWAIGDFTEGTVHKTLLGSVGLILFGFIAHWICRNKPNIKTYPISLGTGNFPWIVIAATVGLLVSSSLYSGYLSLGWMPTFLPGCTIPAALVIMYGGGWRVSLTGGILSGIVQFPLSFLAVNIASKIGMPSLVMITILGMSLGGIIIVEIFRLFPWVRNLVKGDEAPITTPYKEKVPVPAETSTSWIIKRTLADFTELFFFGNEIAAAGLIIGGILSWMLNPAHIAYGVPYLFPTILFAQLIGGSLSAFLYYDKWATFGFYPTFTVAVSAGVIILFLGASIPLAICCVILSVIITPNLAWVGMSLATRYASRYPAMIGTVVGMGLGIAIVTLVLKFMLFLF